MRRSHCSLLIRWRTNTRERKELPELKDNVGKDKLALNKLRQEVRRFLTIRGECVWNSRPIGIVGQTISLERETDTFMSRIVWLGCL